MFKRKPKVSAAANGTPHTLRMSRGLRKAVSALERYADDEEKRKAASSEVSENPNISKMWGI